MNKNEMMTLEEMEKIINEHTNYTIPTELPNHDFDKGSGCLEKEIENRIREIFREELIKVLDELNDIFDRGDVQCDKYGDYWRREISPLGAIRKLKDKLEHKE